MCINKKPINNRSFLRKIAAYNFVENVGKKPVKKIRTLVSRLTSEGGFYNFALHKNNQLAGDVEPFTPC
ncbi:hypothetical protein C9980_25245 [Vibrio mediterranei]|nr:hypothetical protein C9980_25245 [Vibrio mediterranei]